ncbi:hypothetical protein ACJO2E_08755 [Marinobacter sp. M1N3S26]|uniref:hypothetical protein n=1 Tax=Marinobacter sp. M1N3S26 TaxID=3382299 RepID=UPI00387AC66E
MRIVQQPLFRVPTDSRTHAALARDAETRAQVEAEWTVFCKKYGGDRLYAGATLEGITFDDKSPPEGWVRCKSWGVAYRPSLKGPLSEAAKDFKALPAKPDMLEFLRSLGLDIHPLKGRFLTPGYAKRDGTWHLFANPGCPIPDDVVELVGEERDAIAETIGRSDDD